MFKGAILGLAAACALAACGGDDGNGNGGGGGGGSGGTAGAAGAGAGGSAGTPGGLCDPTPARCDALGKERPFRVSEHAAAYLEDELSMIMFGGSSAVPEQCNIPGPKYNGETWLYDDPCGKWTQVQGAGPSARGRHAMAAGGGAAWLFGGRFRDATVTMGPYTLYDDLWRFDPTARTWSQVSAASAPPKRASAALAWDSKRNALWLVGGNASTSGASYAPLGDVWRFDPTGGTWTQESPSGTAPKSRLMHAMLYDAARDRLVVFGGADETAFANDAKYMKDLWALDLTNLTWSLLDDGTASAPDGRFWPTLVHDTRADGYLLFAGHDDAALGNRNDAWRFDPTAGSWAALELGDSYNKPANGFCDFPPDFANVNTAVPERRSAHSFVWSEPCGRAISFGGKTDCGATDDVWHFADGVWTERVKATEGEVCLRWRPNPAECTNMCS